MLFKNYTKNLFEPVLKRLDEQTKHIHELEAIVQTLKTQQSNLEKKILILLIFYRKHVIALLILT